MNQFDAKLPQRIRSVMIVDDHPLYSDALALVIQELAQTKRIELSSSLSEANSLLAKRFLPSIVFFDLNLPDVAGMSGFLSLKKKIPNTPIVVISATCHFDIMRMVDEAGGAGYIPKNLARDELKDALLKVLGGGRYFPSEYTDAQTHTPQNRDDGDLQDISQKLAKLTPQQTKILQMICEGKLNKQIAYELDLAEATVKTHITALMRKLDVQNRTQAALLVRDAMSAADLE